MKTYRDQTIHSYWQLCHLKRLHTGLSSLASLQPSWPPSWFEPHHWPPLTLRLGQMPVLSPEHQRVVVDCLSLGQKPCLASTTLMKAYWWCEVTYPVRTMA